MKVLLLTIFLATIGLSYGQDAVCDGAADGAFVDDPSSCPGWFQCIDGIATAGKCPVPYMFYPADQTCSYSTGDCYGYWLITTEAPPTADPDSTTVASECTPGELYEMAHPTDCTLYILCYNGKAIEKSCAPGLNFSPTDLECMTPETAGCVVNPCPEEDPELPMYVPNNDDCNAYYICMNGEPVAQTCYPGYVFDISIDSCNVPENTDTSHCSATASSPAMDPIFRIGDVNIIDDDDLF